MSKLNYLHCVNDSYFTLIVINEFEHIKEKVNSLYAICTFKKGISFQYINEVKDRIDIVSPLYLNRYIKEHHINVIVLHNLLSLHYINILTLPSNVKIVWFAWGKDIYEYPQDKPFVDVKRYMPITSKVILRSPNQSVPQKIKQYFRNYFLRKIIPKIDFFSGVLPNEYKMISKTPGFRAKEIIFHYTRFNTSPNIFHPQIEGDNILIGNSADPSNNHLDIMEKLSKYNIGERYIYVPLSYGGNKEYIQLIINKGREMWGMQFVPLLDFLPHNEYKKILSSCGFHIFGHERQQAIGNISIGLKNGSKVFLSKTSIAYEYFKDAGMRIYSIQDELGEDELNKKLTKKEIEKNIDVMNKYRSSEVFYKDLLETIETINSSILD